MQYDRAFPFNQVSLLYVYCNQKSCADLYQKKNYPTQYLHVLEQLLSLLSYITIVFP